MHDSDSKNTRCLYPNSFYKTAVPFDHCTLRYTGNVSVPTKWDSDGSCSMRNVFLKELFYTTFTQPIKTKLDHLDIK